jgi:HPt (histidine-containing phosphotransfer) domain-containing protein
MDNATEALIPVEIDQELRPIVPEYLEKRLGDCGEIERLLATGGFESIEILGHQLKGSGGSFGFDELSAIGAALECAAQTADREGIRSLVGRMEEYLKRVSVAYI